MLNKILNWLCRSKMDNCEKKVEELEKDAKYYQERIDALSAIIARSIEIPDIKNFLENRNLVRPYDIITNMNIICADLDYYKLYFTPWKEVLSTIDEKFKKVHPYIPEVWDCDDFALFFAGIVAYCSKMAGLNKQLAFAICWSSTHAFNLFIDENNDIWIYEPQNNNIIGLLGKVPEPYVVKMVWFMS